MIRKALNDYKKMLINRKDFTDKYGKDPFVIDLKKSILIYPKDIIYGLKLFIDKKVSLEDFIEWSSLIALGDPFSYVSKYADVLVEVMQELERLDEYIDPSTFLTPELANTYIYVLENNLFLPTYVELLYDYAYFDISKKEFFEGMAPLNGHKLINLVWLKSHIIIGALNKFKDHKVTFDELLEWANFLLTSGYYFIEDKQARFAFKPYITNGKSVRSVLNKLVNLKTAPSANEINSYIDILEKNEVLD